MKREKLTSVLDRIDDRYLAEASAFGSSSSRADPAGEPTDPHCSGKPARRFRWGVLAACLAVAALLGSAVAVLAAEAKEYQDAVTFFEQNGLSAEGLSRADIKAVYRDISSQQFRFDKTAEVIRRNVPGYEIYQEEPTPEELRDLWEHKAAFSGTVSKSGNRYSFRCQYTENAHGGKDFAKSVLECRHGDDRLWSAEFPEFYIASVSELKDGIAVCGYSYDDTGYRVFGWLARVSADGQKRWVKRLDHGSKTEFPEAVLDNGDGTWAAVSQADGLCCVAQFDPDGNETGFRTTDVGRKGIDTAARIGDGYLIKLRGDDADLLIRLDRDGTFLEQFSYQEEDQRYYLTDMAEFGGQIYISAYAVPGLYENEAVLAELSDRMTESGDFPDPPSEELTPLVRANYCAVLLLCDPDGGKPQTFYSVPGSLGAGLSVNGDGELEWNVNSIVSTFFSPMTNSFTIGGTCKVYRYTFNENGALIRETDTGETSPYYR